MSGKIKKAVIGAALVGASATPLFAQDHKITQELMASSNPNERVLSRTIGKYDGKEYKLFGMFDAAFSGKDYFLLLSAHRELGKGAELVLESTKSKNNPADIGVGFGYDLPMPKNSYLNPHVLPLNFQKGGVARRSEVEVLGGVEFKRGYYMEGRGQLSIPYHQKMEYTAEFSAGKKLTERLATQASVAHNSRGNAARADIKWGLYKK